MCMYICVNSNARKDCGWEEGKSGASRAHIAGEFGGFVGIDGDIALGAVPVFEGVAAPVLVVLAAEELGVIEAAEGASIAFWFCESEAGAFGSAASCEPDDGSVEFDGGAPDGVGDHGEARGGDAVFDGSGVTTDDEGSWRA
jgi:hypothetical protein